MFVARLLTLNISVYMNNVFLENIKMSIFCKNALRPTNLNTDHVFRDLQTICRHNFYNL